MAVAGNITTFAGTDVSAFRLVKFSAADEVGHTAAGETPIGVTAFAASAGKPVAVCPLLFTGTLIMIAAAAITAGAVVYTAADGKVSSTAIGDKVGIARTGASANGDEVEVLPLKVDDYGDHAAVFTLGDHFGSFDYDPDATGRSRWVLVQSDVAVITETSTGVRDAVGGVMRLDPSDHSVGADDEVYLRTRNKLFKFAAGKNVSFEAKFAITEASTNQANFFAGLSSVAAANFLQDADAGPAADFIGAGFFKNGPSGSAPTKFKFITSNGTTQEIDADIGDRVSGQYYTGRFECRSETGDTEATITAWLDGVQVFEKDDYPLAGTAEMYAVFGLKCGTTARDLLDIDYVFATQGL